MSKKAKTIFICILIICGLLNATELFNCIHTVKAISVDELPTWQGKAYTIINENKPDFTNKQMKKTTVFVRYSKLDDLGRAGAAIGCLGTETLNENGRTTVGRIRPSGWETKKYPKRIKDRYVYNRCHLLMQAAAGGVKTEECNSEKNLITGTRYLNVDGMLPFETKMLEYIRWTGNHILYRVTPVFRGNELVARGVQMEAYSVEDAGDSIQFNVYCYNMQPGITIDYATGKTSKKKNAEAEMEKAVANGSVTVNVVPDESDNAVNENVKKNTREYVLNTNTKRIHLPECPSVGDIFEKNKKTGIFSKKQLLKQGYVPCKRCCP